MRWVSLKLILGSLVIGMCFVATVGIATSAIGSSLENNALSKQQSSDGLQWVKLKSDIDLHRSKVPGGWLLYSKTRDHFANGLGVGSGIAFMPDPEHRWDGNSLP